MTKTTTSQSTSLQQESLLADELELISLLRAQPDILRRHPKLLLDLDIPHPAEGAVSLIERQVSMLRERLNANDRRLRELMDIARDNERLANSRHRIGINLLGAHDLNDVISSLHDELGNELKADFVVVRLLSDDEQLLAQKPELFVHRKTVELSAFSTMLKHQKPVCGRGTAEQKAFLFGENAASVGSVAVIPLVAGADLGVLGLGGREAGRFTSSMGTEFLSQIGEMVSAALAVHLEQ